MQRKKGKLSPMVPPVANSPPHSSPLLPNLPDEVALQCIARVPRYCHGKLSLVSKSWRSLIFSPIFFSTRKRLNCTRHVLYLNASLDLMTGSIGPTNKWLTLDIDHPNPKNPTYLSHVSPNPSMSFFRHPSRLSPISYSSIAVLGPKIYFLGSSIGPPDPSCSRNYSSTVWILDCRYNEWRIGPRMGVGRSNAAAAACVVNGKIYVMGGCCDEDSSNWAEVLDPTLGYWVTVPSPIEVRMKQVSGTALIGEKFYIWGSSFLLHRVIFDPCDSSWHEIPIWLVDQISWIDGSACVVDGILYRPALFDGDIEGLDVKVGKWQTVNLAHKDWGSDYWFRYKTVNVGGRLLVLWKEDPDLDLGEKQYSISCAEVEVRKDSNGGLWGSIVSSQLLMLVPCWPGFDDWCTVEL